ncbi:hypothetical protein BKA65DRAFT_491505 [Rhexocercosporidium sp. MPI-PUGE-AT-0058]|nr:hypothetical protein BKA65DRAFT_491505 [Rhexocercosporidium sp. MPI-PUGE-AT-0058]
MMFSTNIITLLLAISTACVTAAPFASVGINHDHLEVLQIRASKSINPDAVFGTKCIDTSANIVFHDENVAQLGICGGIAGAITKCGGAPESTTGSSGTALFKLNVVDAGATINVSKGRWEGCVRAARAVCPSGTFSSTCVGGASTGNIAFTLSAQ